jgi:hypothetical protein
MGRGEEWTPAGACADGLPCSFQARSEREPIHTSAVMSWMGATEGDIDVLALIVTD